MGSGAPNPKGKKIDEATVISKTDISVMFEMKSEDVDYFEDGKTYQLIAVDKTKD